MQNESWRERWECHQKGCAFRKRGKWIMMACDMNCDNVFEFELALKEKEIGIAYQKGYHDSVDDDFKDAGGLKKILQEEREKWLMIIRDIKSYAPDGEIGTLCDQALSDIKNIIHD